MHISVLSTEYVRVTVAATEDGAPVDPTLDPVYMAFTDGADPVSGDWHPAQWEAAGSIYYARILVGPTGTVTLGEGTYAVWVMITDSPETPVRHVGFLIVGDGLDPPLTTPTISAPAPWPPSDPFVIYQGATFDKTLTWLDPGGNPIDLTGWVGSSTIEPFAGGETLLAFTVTLGGAAGTIRLQASAAATAAMTDSGRWDLKITDGVVVIRIAEADAKLDEAIT